MKCYDMRYMAKELEEAREKARRYKPIESAPRERQAMPDSDIKILFEHYRCSECRKTYAAADMHSYKVYCKKCAAKLEAAQ